MFALLTRPGDTIQTGTGKVNPARKFKCTTAARELYTISSDEKMRSSGSESSGSDPKMT